MGGVRHHWKRSNTFSQIGNEKNIAGTLDIVSVREVGTSIGAVQEPPSSRDAISARRFKSTSTIANTLPVRFNRSPRAMNYELASTESNSHGSRRHRPS